jgi:hypothetical protein
MEDFTEYLLVTKERLEGEKKATEVQNEEQALKIKVKEETAHKRIISKLQKDANP